MLYLIDVCVSDVRFLDPLLIAAKEKLRHLHELICSGAVWAEIGTESPVFSGLRAGIAPVSAPHLSKESEQGGREETTT